MKSKIRVIIITMIVLIAGTGFFLWKADSLSKKLSAQREERLDEESDLLEDQKGKAIDKINEVDITPLYISGSEKNVVTTDIKTPEAAYSLENSAKAEENITTIKENKTFTSKEPFWAYNPFGTNNASMYLYFNTSGKCYCRYTISVKDSDIPDFTRTAQSMSQGSITKEHEYQIIGLVPGKKNYIILNLYNENDKLSETRTFSVDMPASKTGAQPKLGVIKGRSKDKLENGLYAVFSAGKKKVTTKKILISSKTKKGKKKYKTRKKVKYENAILLYDNSGILRGEIPTSDYVGQKIITVYDTILYASGKRRISEVNAIGQVVKSVDTGKYRLSGEFDYDDCGNVYVIVTKDGDSTPNSRVVMAELENGKVSEMVNMSELLSGYRESLQKKNTKLSKNWIDLNSVQVAGTNKLLLSARGISSIFKVKNIGSLMTGIEYVIADKKIYKNYKPLEKKVLKKAKGGVDNPVPTPVIKNILDKKVVPEPFYSQYSQQTLQYKKVSGSKYYLSMLNVNTSAGVKGNGSSYFYKYLVNENAKSYKLKEKKVFEQTKKDGSIYSDENGFIYCCSDSKLFIESDKTGKLIRQYNLKRKPYKVIKCDFKNFWFN